MPDFRQIDDKVKSYTATHVHIALAVVFLLGVVAGHFS